MYSSLVPFLFEMGNNNSSGCALDGRKKKIRNSDESDPLRRAPTATNISFFCWVLQQFTASRSRVVPPRNEFRADYSGRRDASVRWIKMPLLRLEATQKKPFPRKKFERARGVARAGRRNRGRHRIKRRVTPRVGWRCPCDSFRAPLNAVRVTNIRRACESGYRNACVCVSIVFCSANMSALAHGLFRGVKSPRGFST